MNEEEKDTSLLTLHTASTSLTGFMHLPAGIWEHDLTRQLPQPLLPSPAHCWLHGHSPVRWAMQGPINISWNSADGQTGFSNKDGLKPLGSSKSKMKPPAVLLPLGKQHHQRTNRKGHWNFRQEGPSWEIWYRHSAAGARCEVIQAAALKWVFQAVWGAWSHHCIRGT